MKTNVGGIDRILRIVIGLALNAAALTGVIGWWGLIGIVPLTTGVESAGSMSITSEVAVLNETAPAPSLSVEIASRRS